MNPQEKKITLTFPNYPAPDGSIVKQKWSASTLRQLPYFERALADPQWEDPANPAIEMEDDPKIFLKLVNQVLSAPHGGSDERRMADFYGLELGESAEKQEPVRHKEILKMRKFKLSKVEFTYIIKFGDLAAIPKDIVAVEFFPSSNMALDYVVLGSDHIYLKDAHEHPQKFRALVNTYLPRLRPSEQNGFRIGLKSNAKTAPSGKVHIHLEYLA